MAQIAIIGPQLAVYVNSNIFGICNHFTYSVDYAVVSNVGIDVMGPVEITPRII
jgi:hypothetical protein